MSETQVLILLILICLSALFSGAETALVSLSMIKVNSLIEQKRRGAETLLRIKQDPHRLIITILIGNNLVNITAASLATVTFTNLFGSTGIGIATGIMTFLILVFGEIVPKTFASQHAEKISLLLARPVELLSILLSPAIRFFESISQFVSHLIGTGEEAQLSEEEVRTIVNMGFREGLLSQRAAAMMNNLLEFEQTKVTKIMVPQASIEMVDGNIKLKEIFEFLVKKSYSRYPVFSQSRDRIIGILDIDDVLKCIQDKKMDVWVKDIVRPVTFVPQSEQITHLLSRFEGQKVPLAIVVDEYGNVEGLVTLEDILEEIVGDIFDKSNKAHLYIKKINDQISRVDAKASIEEVNKILHLGLEKGHFNTIAGFVEYRLQKIPTKGEQIRLRNAIIEVDEANAQGISSLKVRRI